MLSKNNKIISCKVSNDVYKYINTFSIKYGVSMSVFIQDCITQNILNIDKASNSDKYNTPEEFYKKYSYFLKQSYDERKTRRY